MGGAKFTTPIHRNGRSSKQRKWLERRRDKPWSADMKPPLIVSHRDGHGRTSLMLAAHQRHDSCVRMLLEYGANPDDSVRATGWTPLMFALRSGAVESCRMLLEAGASAGFKPRTSSLATPSNRSGQHRKLEAGQQRLHDRCLFPRDKQSGWTPVMIAAHNCLGSSHAACMKLLLESAPRHLDPVLWSRADPVAYPGEERSAEDLA